MHSMTIMLIKKKVELLTLFLIVVGAINWGLVGLFGINIVSFVTRYTIPWLENYIYILIGCSALFHIFARNFYLPFLGDAAFPCGIMLPKTPENANVEVKVVTKPKSNVVFWAAESHKEVVSNPWIAYDQFSNAGVTRSDVNGVAILRFRQPTTYKAGLRTLAPHVHYRVCKHPGILGEVQTVYTPQ